MTNTMIAIKAFARFILLLTTYMVSNGRIISDTISPDIILENLEMLPKQQDIGLKLSPLSIMILVSVNM